MAILQILPNLVSGEQVAVGFDFPLPIAQAVVSAETWQGTDANPSSTLIGSATVSGSTATQLIGSGVVGVTYRYLCKATLPDGQILIIPAQIGITEY